MYQSPCAANAASVTEDDAFASCQNRMVAIADGDAKSSCSAPCSEDWQCYAPNVEGACYDHKCVQVCTGGGTCDADASCVAIGSKMSACMYSCAVTDIGGSSDGEDIALWVLGMFDLVMLLAIIGLQLNKEHYKKLNQKHKDLTKTRDVEMTEMKTKPVTSESRLRLRL